MALALALARMTFAGCRDRAQAPQVERRGTRGDVVDWMSELKLTLSTVAESLAVSERTVEQWVQSRGLPAVHLNGQYRFNGEQLLAWATINGAKVSPELVAGVESESAATPSLADAIALGGVCRDLVGADKAAVLKSVVMQLPQLAPGERELLLQVLLAREELGSTGVGGGVAIPHPRQPIVLDVDRPLVTVSFLRTGIDFGALDNLPVHTLFMIVTPSTRLHLQLLSRLAFTLHDAAFKALLERRAEAAELLPVVRQIEATIRSRPASA